MSENIKVKKKIISGIKNPLFNLVGSYCDDFELKVMVDEEKRSYNIFVDKEKKEFTISTILNKGDKKIEVFEMIDGHEFLITQKRNMFFSRVWEKICSMWRRFFHFLWAVLVTLKKGIVFFWKKYHFLVPPSLWGKYLKDFKTRVHQRGVRNSYNPFYPNEYFKWIQENEAVLEPKEFAYQPLISVLIPVYNIKREFLSECIDSVLNQIYPHFEICLVDDCSTLEETKETLKEYEKKDQRIHVKYRKKNGHISNTTNDALNMAKGEFVALLDNDDTLASNALYEVVQVLNENKDLDFIYSDEDKIDLKGHRCDPHFKPDWSPDTLLSLNYICHLAVLRKKIVQQVGGFTVGLEGAQDYDLFLKVTEKTDRIYHIPKILYHWRMIEGSTAMNVNQKSYAIDKGKKALEEALKRRGEDALVEYDEDSGYYKIRYKFQKEPSVSILIPTKDFVSILKTCVDSIIEKTSYKNYEIVIINNQSVLPETFEFFQEYQKKYSFFKVIDADMEFNYSKINNMAVQQVKSDYIVLLNNDTEILTPDWLELMIGYASRKHVGAVGVKLLYPDMTIQHGGVILGLGGVASHAYIGKERNELGMYGRLRVPYNYSAVTAACLAISRKKFLEVGGLEEELKVAYNDIDFCLKLLKKGYYNVFLPQVELIHYESKTRGYDNTEEKYKRFKQEEEYMYQKWQDVLLYDAFYNFNFSRKDCFMLKKK